MTKKDYKLIAEAISISSYFEYVDDGYDETPSKNTVIDFHDLIVKLGMALEKENSNFNQYKFWDACTPKEKK